jgi:hypothetical protein
MMRAIPIVECRLALLRIGVTMTGPLTYTIWIFPYCDVAPVSLIHLDT